MNNDRGNGNVDPRLPSFDQHFIHFVLLVTTPACSRKSR